MGGANVQSPDQQTNDQLGELPMLARVYSYQEKRKYVSKQAKAANHRLVQTMTGRNCS